MGDIFVITHKDFDMELLNPVYKVVCAEDEDVNMENVIRVPRTLSNDGWSELAKIWELMQSYDFKDYVGLCHYHRFFKFGENVPNLEEITKDRYILGLLVSNPFLSIRDTYGACHNVEDFDLCMDIVKEMYPDKVDDVEFFSKQNILFASNCIILNTEDFKSCYDFVFKVLFEWCRRMGIDPTKDEDFHKRVNDNIEKYSKKHKPDDDDFSEQTRICGFLSERLMTLWTIFNPKNMELNPVVEHF